MPSEGLRTAGPYFDVQMAPAWMQESLRRYNGWRIVGLREWKHDADDTWIEGVLLLQSPLDEQQACLRVWIQVQHVEVEDAS